MDIRPATRAAATTLLCRAATADPSLVIGLDFSFSLPAWWLAACRIGSVAELWEDRSRLERWLARCEPPFWGRPGRRRPPAATGEPLRRTERAAPGRPFSTFQIGGAGAVGTASLRGMPALAELRRAGLAVWPFDPWRPPVVAEVWPRMALGPLVKSDRAARQAWADRHRDRLGSGVGTAVTDSPDALDAVAAALWLAAQPPGACPLDAQVALEGWILGVAPLG